MGAQTKAETSNVSPESFAGFLGYLDKEMTIMGILSSFCVAVLLLMLGKLPGFSAAELPLNLRLNASFATSGASILLLLASGFFYAQRSSLAWYYGEITYRITNEEYTEARECLAEVQDSKRAWRSYFYGFAVLFAGLSMLIISEICSNYKTLCMDRAALFVPLGLGIWIPSLLSKTGQP